MEKTLRMLRLHLEEREKEWLVKLGAGLLAAGLCFGIILFPMIQDIVKLQEKISKDRQRIDLLREVRSLEKEVAGLEAPLAAWTDRSLMMGKIADVADKSGVRVQNLVPRTVREGAYVRLSVEVEGNGTFFDQLRFLKALEVLTPPIRVRDLSLVRDGTKNLLQSSRPKAESLKGRFVVEGYLKPPPGKKKV